MQINPIEYCETSIYKLMMSTILPRPIAWVSTIDKEGRSNIAPFSYFTGVCCKPMTVLFCPVVGDSSRPKKDTLINIEEVPEFVINVATEENISAVNLSATPLDYGKSEFEFVNITPVNSAVVRPPRVAESPIAFECKVRDIIQINDQPGGGWIVVGTVLAVNVNEELVKLNEMTVALDDLKPVARLGGADFLKPSDTFSLKRPTAPVEANT